MKKREREPVIPRTVLETTRHAIMTLLVEGPISAKEISAAVGLPEKEVSGHLEHIRRSLHATSAVLEVEPAECRMCGFVFVKRERMTSPGKCPVCHHEAICDPLFSIRGLQELQVD
ncbi:MAG: ArsR family transcriptional regulator [Desulfocapsaceae bacterium]|nr:ArsR family transcriptional regulator [Desulfocapsaceae bacterium]